MKRKYFEYRGGKLPLPVFFPDATRAVIKTLDTTDIESTSTPGLLVNTFHLWRGLGKGVLKKFGGIGKFMDWKGALISDSGGFQVMSLIKTGEVGGKITDEGVVFYPSKGKKMIFTPEKSIQFQASLGADMMVVLDDFTDPKSTHEEAKESVERTIGWAKRCKDEYLKLFGGRKPEGKTRPYLLGVVQGGEFQDLRKYCANELAKIGFDGFGYGGWPISPNGTFDYQSAKTIVENTPDNYFLYGLGIGKPDEIVELTKIGYNIFDCVLPTRDGRHGRLYVFNSESMEDIDIGKDKFYSFFTPGQEKYYYDTSAVSGACDCILCRRYSRAYISHLFRIKDISAMRLATIHNLRFYSLLMQKLSKGKLIMG